ncbi:hypothetical protein I203_108494 [Kwoniella mangroviensis CBS 8507]|uniref:hypothetical protein n=1 Tax=Kwoniella mangroviensis CBS 8507 TaxID=1296122 RepID=UPI00080D739E|nr:cytochrome P450 [Kwoniella mangroviensis CBS 8507]OCF65709.1 cytochrome P450 [Kwoniella mangroviensis CBS 8507]
MQVVDFLGSPRFPTILETLSLCPVVLLVYLLDTFLLKPLTSPLRHLAGPPGGYGINGHSAQIMDLHGSTVHDWISTYGSTFLVRGPLGIHHRIFTLDPRALSHVLNNTQIYFKSPLLRNLVRRYMKEGLIVAEGERHKLQRKVAQRLYLWYLIPISALTVRSNMAKGLKPDQKLRDHEITGQLSTFMFAGSDTTAGTIAMGLYQLAKHPQVQETLRAEISGYGDNLPYEQIDELPYLDAIAKEVLRINPSLPGTVRQTQQDDVIPLSQPVKLSNGKIVSELRIRKGQLVHIPIEHLHTSKGIWGSNADIFDPSRFLGSEHLEPSKTPLTASFSSTSTSWPMGPTGPTGDQPGSIEPIPRKTSIPSNVPSGPGVWPNFMTFIDGPRRCIGYKLALMEIKIMFFKLIKDFQVLPKEDQRVWRWNMMSTRPYVEGTLYAKGSSLPIIFKHLKGEDETTSDISISKEVE